MFVNFNIDRTIVKSQERCSRPILFTLIRTDKPMLNLNQ